MSNDVLRHEVTEAMALLQEQLADIAAMQRKQAELTGNGAAADGRVEVTVNAHGQLVKTVIDESYLDDFEFEELADHITLAARAATAEVARRVSALMVPINERRKRFPSLADFVEGAPDLRDLRPPGLDPVADAWPGADVDGGGYDTLLPTVRR